MPERRIHKLFPTPIFECKIESYKELNKDLKLHMLGKLQTNKVKNAVEIFDFIHSLDSLKLANKISKEIQNTQTCIAFI